MLIVTIKSVYESKNLPFTSRTFLLVTSHFAQGPMVRKRQRDIKQESHVLGKREIDHIDNSGKVANNGESSKVKNVTSKN